jgi:pimeloyl-ACP methyl ester carboxylesterase
MDGAVTQSSARYVELGLVPLEAHFKLLFIAGADMADDIEHLRATLGLKRISLLGHSDSGSYSGRTKALMVANSPVPVNRPGLIVYRPTAAGTMNVSA